MADDDRARQLASLQQQLKDAEENLRLIQEQMHKYVEQTEIPLHLRKEEQHTQNEIARLKEEINRVPPPPPPLRKFSPSVAAAVAVVAIVFFVGLALWPQIRTLLFPVTTRPFTYQVRVEAKATSEYLSEAKVTIEVGGKAPLDGITDVNGLGRIPVPSEYAGQPAVLIVEAEGYRRYRQNVDLVDGALPQVVRLEVSRPVASPPPSAPTVTPIASTPTPTLAPTSTLTPMPTPKIVPLSDLAAPGWWMAENGITPAEVISLTERPGNCHTGSDCLQWTYIFNGSGWGGVMWWPYDCESQKGKVGKEGLTCGINVLLEGDFSTVYRLTFWARGELGDERIEFAVGSTGDIPPTPARSMGTLTLTSAWQRYEIDLRDMDLTNAIALFYWGATDENNPQGAVFYLDDIQLEGVR